MRVLLAEDELDAARVLAKELRERSFAVDISAEGEEAVYLSRRIASRHA